MRTRIRQIARAGVFGSTENPQRVSEKDLQEIYESFQDMNSSPITIGHNFSANEPRLGNVVGLELKDGVLYGITEEQDALAKAVDDGFFTDVSIGAKRSAETGKMYLHHLAYLGEEPPAIKDLRSKVKNSLAISASDTNVVFFPATKNNFSLSDKTKGVFMNDEELKKKIAELEAENEKLKAEAEKANAEGDNSEDAEVKKLRSENAELKKKLDAFLQKYPEDDLALSDASPQTKSLMAELRKGKRNELLSLAKNKLSPACEPALIALSDSLSVTGELALSDGEKMSAHDCLKSILNELPHQMWTEDVIALSDTKEKKTEPVDVNKMMGCI
ncbi:MAG: hypothetical protein P1P59_07140 [Treponemataceae bacterium]